MIEEANFPDFNTVFPKDDIFKLFQLKLIQVVPNFNLNPILKKEKYGLYKADFLPFGIKNIQNINRPFGFIEEKFQKSQKYTPKEVSKFILHPLLGLCPHRPKDKPLLQYYT